MLNVILKEKNIVGGFVDLVMTRVLEHKKLVVTQIEFMLQKVYAQSAMLHYQKIKKEETNNVDYKNMV